MNATDTNTNTFAMDTVMDCIVCQLSNVTMKRNILCHPEGRILYAVLVNLAQVCLASAHLYTRQ